MVYNYEYSFNYSLPVLLQSFLYGIRLDISLTGYIMILPAIILLSGKILKKNALSYIFSVYSILILLAVLFIILADAELYRNWGFKIDKTGLLYLKTPKEALASSKISLVIVFLIVWLTLVTSFFLLFRKHVACHITNSLKKGWESSIGFFLILISLIIPIRGTFGIATINVSAVYFHKDLYPNHAAVNPAWNVIYSLSVDESKEQHSFFTQERCNSTFSELMQRDSSSMKVLNTDNPNIIIIILESFSAKFIEPLGGEPDVTPNFNNLCKEGILFQNFYANGDRSDKGLVSIISGFPAQPTTSIIKYPNKTQNLNFLNLSLKQKGYSSAFYYGGNLNFANIKSYFVNGKFDKLITVDDFSSDLNMGKWGVPDEYVFGKLYNDICKENQPFINTIFSLSNHEPFDIPVLGKFPGSDEDNLFRSSTFYTDYCLGKFIDQSKKEDWWDNTLCIIVADHGSRLPGTISLYSLDKFRIPMLWIGGALTVKDTINSNFGTQSDIPNTVLTQLDISDSEYIFGKDIFSPGVKDFSFYAFNDGFGFIDKDGYAIYAHVSDQLIKSSDMEDTIHLNYGKAYLQKVMSEFLK